LAGEEAGFVVLPDGSYVVEAAPEPFDVGVLVQSLELVPPFRVEAVRRMGTTWVVGARTIVVVELSASLLGDELEIVWDGSERSARVDGVPTLMSVFELEVLGNSRFDTWVVRARRLRGAFWEVEVGPL
jgi:hypothetical protein